MPTTTTTTTNIVEDIVGPAAFREGSARPAALPRLQNARQGVPHRRNARQEALRMAVFARPAVLPEQNAVLAVYRDHMGNAGLAVCRDHMGNAGLAVCRAMMMMTRPQIISRNLSFF